MRRFRPLLFLALSLSVVASSQDTSKAAVSSQAGKTDAELDAEALQANALYQQSQVLASLPLFEELHAQRPKRLDYTERLGMAYVAKAGAASSPAERDAARKRALSLLQEAHAGGDNSDLVQIMLEKLSAPDATATASAAPLPPWRQDFNEAEVLFSKGDLKGAVELYAKSWQANPAFYSAPLFAGDAEYKLNHYDEAGVWFARAIAINPDLETAHRYWADCLAKAGKPAEAREQYISAFIADPYQKAPRLELRAALVRTRERYAPPAITLPPVAQAGKDGHINVTVDPSKLNDPLAAAWIGYPMQTIAWQNGRFAQQYPNEKTYRHSLAEETESLRNLLKVVRSLNIPEAKYDDTVRNLIALEKDNMIECWILLDAPDNGTARDYAAYRAAHRDLLRAYLEKYDIHPA